ncbi:unnamed protein product [Protopolystoma xenopodis]|uniref:Uncharacterized protein n=1 Tax=Protopolystoma xenopodis TaxID=117903 RepID=A0A3S5A7H8_9PLAT|nr:unnamed protein product [Protopolystoma xenopodis]
MFQRLGSNRRQATSNFPTPSCDRRTIESLSSSASATNYLNSTKIFLTTPGCPGEPSKPASCSPFPQRSASEWGRDPSCTDALSHLFGHPSSATQSDFMVQEHFEPTDLTSKLSLHKGLTDKDLEAAGLPLHSHQYHQHLTLPQIQKQLYHRQHQYKQYSPHSEQSSKVKSIARPNLSAPYQEASSDYDQEDGEDDDEIEDVGADSDGLLRNLDVIRQKSGEESVCDCLIGQSEQERLCRMGSAWHRHIRKSGEYEQEMDSEEDSNIDRPLRLGSCETFDHFS